MVKEKFLYNILYYLLHLTNKLIYNYYWINFKTNNIFKFLLILYKEILSIIFRLVLKVLLVIFLFKNLQ